MSVRPKAVSRSAVAVYARSAQVSLNSEQFFSKPFATTNDTLKESDLSNALTNLDLRSAFPSLANDKKEPIDQNAPTYKCQGWTKKVDFRRKIEKLQDFLDFEMLGQYEKDIEIFKEKTSLLNDPPEVTLIPALEEDSSYSWIIDSSKLGEDETLEDHKSVIKGLVDLERQSINMSLKTDRLAKFEPEPFTLDMPLLPFETPIDAVRYLEPDQNFLQSDPTLADLDLSKESIGIQIATPMYNLNDLTLGKSKLLNSKSVIDPFELELPEFPEPVSLGEVFLGSRVQDDLVKDSSHENWAQADEITPVSTQFVTSGIYEEAISKITLMRLPFPEVPITAYQTRLPPVLPPFDWMQWDISYSLVCSLNWTPFSSISKPPAEEEEVNSGRLDELRELFKERYTAKSTAELFSKISKSDNVQDEYMVTVCPQPLIPTSTKLATLKDGSLPTSQFETACVETNSIIENSGIPIAHRASVPERITGNGDAPYQFDLDMNSILSSDEEVFENKVPAHPVQTSRRSENLRTDYVSNKLLDTSNDSVAETTAFKDFSSAFGIQSIDHNDSPTNRVQKRKHEYESPTSDIDWEFFQEPVSKKTTKSVVMHDEKLENVLSNLDKESNESWNSFDQLIAKRKEGISIPQSSTLIQPRDLLSFSPFFASLSKGPTFGHAPKVSDSSSVLEGSEFDTSVIENNKFSATIWNGPPNSNTATKVVVNTSVAPLSILRLFHEDGSEVEPIEADLGTTSEREGIYAADFYLSHKACVVLIPLAAVGQRNTTGGLKAIRKLDNLKNTVEIVFSIIMIDQSKTLSRSDLENIRTFQVIMSKYSWNQTFVIDNSSPRNLPNFIAHLAHVHGTDLPLDIFENVPSRSLHFLKLCKINCIAAALLLRDMNLFELIQMSPAHFGIKYGDIISEEQFVSSIPVGVPLFLC